MEVAHRLVSVISQSSSESRHTTPQGNLAGQHHVLVHLFLKDVSNQGGASFWQGFVGYSPLVNGEF